MNPDIQKMQELIAKNKIDSALQTLLQLSKNDADIYSQASLLSARFNDVRRKENLNLLSPGEASIIRNQVNYALLDLINEYQKNIAEKESIQKTVFISYNHNDTAIANKLKEKLEAQGIAVTIDSEKMGAGEDIKVFIETSVRDTETTISIISGKSLLSAWVAMETINTYYHEKTNNNKKFIPCYVEDSFFDRGFTDNALNMIDEELRKIEVIKKDRMDKGRDSRDLNNEYSRLKELSHNIDEIVRRLRESLCIDIRNDSFDQNLPKILRRIQE